MGFNEPVNYTKMPNDPKDMLPLFPIRVDLTEPVVALSNLPSEVCGFHPGIFCLAQRQHDALNSLVVFAYLMLQWSLLMKAF